MEGRKGEREGERERQGRKEGEREREKERERERQRERERERERNCLTNLDYPPHSLDTSISHFSINQQTIVNIRIRRRKVILENSGSAYKYI